MKIEPYHQEPLAPGAKPPPLPDRFIRWLAALRLQLLRLPEPGRIVVTGHGGISQSATPGLSNIGAGWQTLPADTSMAAADTVGVEYDLANNAMHFLEAAVWHLDVIFTLSHNELNAGRTFNVRLYNVTDATELLSAPMFVGRNMGGKNVSLSALFAVPESAIGDDLVLQIGGSTSSFSSVVLESYRFDAHRVSGS